MTKTKTMVGGAMIAAFYTALTLLLAPISFGMGQVRLSEALTILPVFSASAIPGLTVGCFLSNLIGLFMGANILGPLDILFGTAATLIAALLTRLTRNIKLCGFPILAPLFPVVVNALVIGWEIYIVTAPPGEFLPLLLLTNMLWVGVGQLLSCYVVGLPLYYVLQRTGLDKRLF